MTMMTAIGLMSGTSMDGIDIALLRSDGKAQVDFGRTMALDYPASVRRQIEACLGEAARMRDRNERPGPVAEVEALVTRWHIRAVQKFLSENALAPADIDLLGFHGQTVLHRPCDALTVQLGDGAMLARETGIDTIYDLRADDMHHGGQGAPLVPVFHQALAQMAKLEVPVAFVNIGGIANITFIGADGELIAFDTGPGNALIDQWVHAQAGIPMDAGGRIASEGRVVAEIVDLYLKAPFFDQSVPKSLDRGDFAPLDPATVELADGARSLCRVTAESIFKAMDHLPETPKSWIICGGGRLNSTIMTDLASLAAPSKVMAAESVGLDGDMTEAQAFAYLAIRSRLGLPLTFPGTTGCREPVTGGLFASAP